MSTPRNVIEEPLLAAAGGDAELARELASLFVTELARLVEEARTAASAGNAPGLERAAHSLKGCAATLGFMDVADRSLALELLARRGMTDAAVLRDDLESLAAASDAADRAVRTYLEEPAV